MKKSRLYLSPECDIQPQCLGGILCDSGMGGDIEDIGYIDWGDLSDGE